MMFNITEESDAPVRSRGKGDAWEGGGHACASPIRKIFNLASCTPNSVVHFPPQKIALRQSCLTHSPRIMEVRRLTLRRPPLSLNCKGDVL